MNPTARLAALGRAAGACTILLAVLTVPPVILAVLVGSPLPGHPTSGGIEGWLRAPLSDRTAIDLAALLAWAGWAHLCACVAAELAGQLRGATRWVALGGPNRLLAARLVAAALLAMHALGAAGPLRAIAATYPATTQTTAAVAPAAPSLSGASRAEVAAVRATPAAPRTAAAAQPAAAVGPGAAPEYVVAPPRGRFHDTLWDIAGRHLGDPLRWREIYALNEGRLMPGGERLTRASLIRPGWTLRLPADATGLHGALAPTPAPIPAPVLPSRQRPTPAAPGKPAPAAQHPTPPANAPGTAPTALPSIRQPVPVEPTAGPGAAGRAAVPPAGPPVAKPQRPAAPTQPDRDQPRMPAVPVEAGLAIGAVAVLAALTRRRRSAARRRRPGTRLALPPGPLGQAEMRLRRQAADAAAVAGVLRLAVTLAGTTAAAGTLSGAVHHRDGTVELLVTGAGEPPAPFTATGRGWQLAPADAGYLFAVSDAPDPAPALIPIGQLAGDACYVNIEPRRHVTIDGEPAAAREIVAGIVRSLAGAGWADQLRLAIPPGLAGVVGGLDRVEILDEPDRQIAGHLDYARTVTAQIAAGHQDLAAARRAGPADTIALILLAGLSPAQLTADTRAAIAAPRSPLFAITIGPDPSAETWHLKGGLLRIPGLDGPITPVRITGADSASAAALLAHATAPAEESIDDPAGGGITEDRPAATLSTTPAVTDRNALPAHQVQVQVLGPVQVAGRPRPTRTAVEDLTVYLATHRRPLTGQQLAAAIWPDREYNASGLRSRISGVRQLLGPDAISTGPQGWQLGEHIGSDWQTFQTLAAGTSTDQQAALALVRGRPFEGYELEWIHQEGFANSVEAVVVDLALTVGAQALKQNDPLAARDAANAGLAACPYDERLYRIGLRSAHSRGARGEARALMRQLRQVLDEDLDPGDEIEAETLSLYDEISRDRRRAG